MLKIIVDLHALHCPWDVESPEYNNKDKRRDAMESFATKYNIATHDMDKKLDNLKSQFQREHKNFWNPKKVKLVWLPAFKVFMARNGSERK